MHHILRTTSSDKGGVKTWTLDRIYNFFRRLKEWRNNLGSQLSGGEQQMLAVGRVLMTNPQLLVLDEATEGHALSIRAKIWQALAELKREGLSQFVMNKNVGALLNFADRHYVLEKGKVVWNGSSDDLRNDTDTIHQYLGV